MLSSKLFLLLIGTCCFSSAFSTLPLYKLMDSLEALLRAKFRDARADFDATLAVDYFEQKDFQDNQEVKQATNVLKEVMLLQQCDPMTLEKVEEVATSLSLGQSGRQFVDEIFRHYAPAAATKCVQYLDDAIERMVNETGSVEDNLDALVEGKLFSYDWVKAFQTSEAILDVNSVAQLLKQLAGNDVQNLYGAYELNHLTGQSEKVEIKINFDQMMRKYLVIPCRKHYHSFGQFEQKLVIVGRMVLKNSYALRTLPDFFDLRPQVVQDALFRYYFCRRIISISSMKRDSILKVLAAEDHHKAQVAAEIASRKN